MARVPLDDLRIEVPLRLPASEALERLEQVCQELARGRFSEWSVSVSREDDALKLVGSRKGTQFGARLWPTGELAVVELSGQAQLNRLTLTIAGGAQGVRRRIRDRIGQELRGLLG